MDLKIYEEIKDVLLTMNVRWVAEHANVSQACLYNWLDGTTQYPRLDTITKVADCLGFDVALIKKAKLKRVA